MNIKLTLQEIIDKLSEKSGQSKKISENFLRILIDVIEEGLKKDGIAKVKGLGTFKIIAIEQRKSVNVQDRSEYIIPAHNKISFTPEKTMKEEINRPYSHLETYTLSEDAPVAVTPDDDDEDIISETIDIEKEETNSTPLHLQNEDKPITSESPTDMEETKDEVLDNNIEKEVEESQEEIAEPTETSEDVIQEEKLFTKEIINSNNMEEIKDIIDSTEETNESISNETNESLTTENELENVANSEEEINEDEIESTEKDEEIISETKLEKEEEVEEKESTKEETEVVEEDATEKPKSKWKKILFTLLLLAILAAIGFFALKHFNLIGDNSSEGNSSSLPPQELTESESPEVTTNETEESNESEDLFFSEESAEGEIVDSENLNEMEENSESEEVYEETAESYTEESVETKTFDNELVKFMSDNYPQLNFPSSCPIKNEVTMTNGNRLTLVSLKNLGHKNFWVYIYYFNRDIISNPNNVPIGAKIKIPDLSSSITNPDSEVCMKAASDVNQKLINK